MKGLRAIACFLRGLGHVLAGLWTLRVRFPGFSPAQREQAVQDWAAAMLRILGITLELRGTPPAAGPVLLVANHISWLDILVLHAARHCRFVSKSDVRHWPLVGALATGAGTLYIERESRRDALRVVHHMAESLRDGDILAVFPEGTTSDGISLLPFHANLLQAAITAQAPVQPVALSFLDAGTRGRSLAPCYIGDDTLLASIWRTLTAPPIVAVVAFGEPEPAQGRERRGWAASLRDTVARLRAG
ncbi:MULTISPECIES: lysophospholipid acyltransferase family protein [Ramlibacter]|uniref:1-acyl-sn-glycerol-3-phosphate acyltransferase n=1 Tax=Ramlibacter aquaticus TaxID=2780094 RepID=A0ABR9SJ28_9BURK|nr:MULTISPECIES: lysophospholipid acyltransferase family protein [Ramlibacter]MBE7941762.1 1-acyl-sn-glycerol-3-phosphate acyltransferase [Ramlibacter aquaticus]